MRDKKRMFVVKIECRSFTEHSVQNGVAVADDVAFYCEFCVHLCKLIFFVCVSLCLCEFVCAWEGGLQIVQVVLCLADVHYLLCSICLTDPKNMLS